MPSRTTSRSAENFFIKDGIKCYEMINSRCTLITAVHTSPSRAFYNVGKVIFGHFRKQAAIFGYIIPLLLKILYLYISLKMC